MSFKSSISLKFGFSNINPMFTKLYGVSFEVQKLFDTNKERKKILNIIKDYTHVNYARLKFLWDISEKCAENGIPGAFVETGVWRGGCAGILSYISKKYGYKHPLYFFDSFEGLPHPTDKDGKDAKKFANNQTSSNLASTQKLKAEDRFIKELLFEKLNVNRSAVKIIKGWFQDTLPIYRNKIGKIAILRLDGDWYESTKVALDNLYDLVVPGGYVVIDDYFYWDGCKKAVDEHIKNKKLNVNLRRQDSSGAYFIKPLS